MGRTAFYMLPPYVSFLRLKGLKVIRLAAPVWEYQVIHFFPPTDVLVPAALAHPFIDSGNSAWSNILGIIIVPIGATC